MTAWSRKTLIFFAKILAFLEKNDPLRYSFRNSVPKGFTASPIDVLCANFVKFDQRNLALFTWQKNKISPGSPAVATAQITLKICQYRARTICMKHSRFHPNRFTLGGVIAERVNTVKTRVKWIQYLAEAHCFEPNKNARSSATSVFYRRLCHWPTSVKIDIIAESWNSGKFIAVAYDYRHSAKSNREIERMRRDNLWRQKATAIFASSWNFKLARVV